MKWSWFSSEWMAVIAIGFGMVVGPEQAMAQRALGIDVSSFQGGSINWSNAKNNSGVTFAWAKATQGNYYIDADFGINETNAKAAGVLIGAYDFADYNSLPGTAGADTEAAYFLKTAGRYLTNGGVYLMPMLDVELALTNNTGATVSAWVDEWCNDVSNYGRTNGVFIRPVVYTYTSFGADYLNSSVTVWPLDMASPNGESAQTGAPNSITPWSTWAFWQYGQGTISGYSSDVDEDVFNGTLATLQATEVITNLISAAPAGSTVYWDPGAKNATPGSGGTGSWSASVGLWWVSGTGDAYWSPSGDYGVFAGTAGTVTLAANMSADGLTFNTAGYTIAGSSTLTLSGTTPVISIPAGTATSINCVLAGSGYEVTGGGVLELENAGNSSGSSSSPVYINGPNTALVVLTNHNTGNTGVTLNLENGGIYQNNDTTSGDQFMRTGCSLALGTGGGIIDNPNASLSMTNPITGSGGLTFTGVSSYTLTLSNAANSYSGGTIVSGPGTLMASVAGALGSTTGALTINGGTLNLGGASHTVGAMTISGGTLTNGTLTGSSFAGQSGAVGAVLAGSGALTQTTTNTLILSGANTFTGGTTIGGGGVYQITSDSALGAASSSLTLNNGCLKNKGSPFALNASRTINLTGNGYFDVVGAPVDSMTVNGQITGIGLLEINLDGSPLVLANTGNNYTGGTIIGTNGPGYNASGIQAYLKLGASGVIPNGSGYGNVVINQAYFGLLDLAGFTQTINGLLGNGTVNNSKNNGSLSVGNNNQTSTFSGVIENTSGTLALAKVGTGVLTLSGTNTYTGNTAISSGALALGSTGSISNSPIISIASSATFDVSAIASYALSSSTTLSASGVGLGLGAAKINGGTTVNLGSQPIILNFDGSHAALTISQGTLSLNGNAITVNGSVLAVGTYTLIHQTTGSVSSSGTFSVSGSAIGAGTTAAISVSGGNVILTITDITTTTLNSLTPSTYGQSVTFTATVAPSPSGGTVQFYDNGVALGSPVTVSSGTASYTSSTLAVGNHPITASYSGITYYMASVTTGASTQQIDPAALSVTANPQSKTYGTLLVFGSGCTNFASSGLQNNETVGSVTLAVNNNGGCTNAPVGTYTITPSLATNGTFTAANYSITYNTNTLTVTLPANTIPVTITGIALLGDGTVQLNFTGTPGYVYLIEAVTDLTPPITWAILNTNAADTNGMFSFIDTNAPSYNAQYYRTATQ